MTRMLQVPRSRGAVSGLLLVLLGLWGALIPLVGPYFHYAYTPTSAWTLTTGRVLDYRARGNDNRKLCSLYLSLLNRMGVKAQRFGDAAAPLTGL